MWAENHKYITRELHHNTSRFRSQEQEKWMNAVTILFLKFWKSKQTGQNFSAKNAKYYKKKIACSEPLSTTNYYKKKMLVVSFTTTKKNKEKHWCIIML